MSLFPISTSSYVFYPPASPDFPKLPSKNITPGSDPEPPSIEPTWISAPAPGVSPGISEDGHELSSPIPIPKANPLPADHVKFPPLRGQTVATEDELPKFSPKEEKTSSCAFTGYD